MPAACGHDPDVGPRRCGEAVVVTIANVPDGYAHVDAAAVLAGDLTPPRPEILRRVDGNHLLYRKRLHWIQGEPEHGKTWLALLAAAERLLAGGIVVYIDFEDSAEAMFGKLLALNPGIRPEIAARFRYIQPPGPIQPDVLTYYAENEFRGADLIVVDACTEAMTVDGLDPNSNADVAKWLLGLPAVAAASGAAVVVIDHVVKDSDARGRWAIGAQHKLAHVPVAYSVTCTEPFAPGAIGRATITISKDRPGGVRSFALGRKTAATLVIDSTVPDCLGAALHVPIDWSGPTRKMGILLGMLQENPAPRSKKEIRDLLGDSKAAREAIERLIVARRIVPSGSRGGWPLFIPAPEPGAILEPQVAPGTPGQDSGPGEPGVGPQGGPQVPQVSSPAPDDNPRSPQVSANRGDQ